MYDVVIIGAGVAGATLARLLAGTHRVLLVDRRDGGEGTRDVRPGGAKLCGGLLAPAAQKELARQGLGVPASVLVGPQVFAVRACDIDSGHERRYQRHYLNIDRGSFDRWLISLAEPHCDARPGWSFDGIDLSQPDPLVRFRTAHGGVASVVSRYVVGADGASSRLRHSVFGSAPASHVAIQGLFKAENAECCYGAVFSPGLTDHYGWSVPKGDVVVAGAAFPRTSGTPDRFETLVEHLRGLGFGLGEELSRASAPLARPLHRRDVELGSGRVALIGEAAGLISPSSAEGISYALRSSAALAASLAAAPADAVYEYRRLARPLVGEVLGKSGKARLLQAPAVRRLALRTGIGAIPDAGVGGFGGMLGELLAP